MEEKILAFCETARTRREIADYCGYKDLRYFAAVHLKPLLDSGRLTMTIPDKPNSRLQRYVATNVSDNIVK